MDELLLKPKNSLINQSVQAHESEEPLNGDGFGVGWYMHQIDPTPALFVSVRPAWNEQNLLYLAPKIETSCICAHVRAASKGQVSIFNCHPFHFREFLFMHNGDIEGFQHIRRPLLRQLKDEYFDMIEGQTDSESLFALFLNEYGRQAAPHEPGALAESLQQAISKVERLKRRHRVQEPTYINAVLTDGHVMVAIRYVTSKRLRAPTLYYSEGSAYECVNGLCRMRHTKEGHSVLVVSEKLTGFEKDWNVIPENHLLLVHRNLRTELLECRL